MSSRSLLVLLTIVVVSGPVSSVTAGEIPTPHAPWKPLDASRKTARVFRYDGSQQCGFEDGVPLAVMRDELLRLGVTPIAEAKLVSPVPVPQACGLPTGVANVFTISQGDLPKILGASPAEKRFALWFFDYETIVVGKYDGSLQCQGGGVEPEEMERELAGAGVTVKNRRKTGDGQPRVAVCGASTGQQNIYEIGAADWPVAALLGYRFIDVVEGEKKSRSLKIAGDDLFPWPW